jgi:hypothetical protein
MPSSYLFVTGTRVLSLQEITYGDDDITCIGNTLASRITYTLGCAVPSATYYLRNGCFGTKSCSAEVLISVSGSGCPAPACSAYSFATSTDSATTQYQLCPIVLYGGYTYNIYTCGSTLDDTYIRLWNPSNTAV